MAEKQPPDDLEALLGEDDPLAAEDDPLAAETTLEDKTTLEEAGSSTLKGVEPKSPPWGPEMFASAAYHRSRYGAEWNDKLAEADDATIAETFALATRLLQAMREELAARLTQ
jgi:hypothetical protein